MMTENPEANEPVASDEALAGQAPAAAHVPQVAPSRRRARSGLVVSTGGQKTVHVRVENLVRHPRYGKYLRRRRTMAAHDADGAAQLGDLVEIVPCRRLSKTKSWRLTRVLREATISTRAAALEKG